MNERVEFLKTTLLGGIVFLLPLVLVVTVIGKGVQIMMKVAEPLDKLIPISSIGGIALVNLIAILIVLVTCFLAGFAARSVSGQMLFEKIDRKLSTIPGYIIFKARLMGNINTQLSHFSLTPAIIDFGPQSQLGFLVQEISKERLIVYLPHVPDPWSGALSIVKKSQVELLDIDVPAVMNIFETFGKNVPKF